MLDLYVDSAVREDVEPLLALGAFKGVTTNPAILHRAGLSGADLPEVYRWAAAAGAEEIFAQAWGDNAEDLVASGQKLMQLGDLTVVKVAATQDGIQAGAQLVAMGIPVLLTVIYAAHQAVTAAAIGAKYLAPYIGKMSDDGRPAREETTTMHRLLRATDCSTRVLAASVRNTADLVYLAEKASTRSPCRSPLPANSSTIRPPLQLPPASMRSPPAGKPLAANNSSLGTSTIRRRRSGCIGRISASGSGKKSY